MAIHELLRAVSTLESASRHQQIYKYIWKYACQLDAQDQLTHR
jgi:hypothetical protein